MNLYKDFKLYESADKPLSIAGRLDAVPKPLLAWYEKNARTLPWREDITPYRVWISEIMLQQTRVEAVKPYYQRFMDRLPDVKALALVDEDVLLKLWEGLGYYSRARNLKKAALICLEEYGGELPGTYEKLLDLPGIGSYTAGAIASIAYGERVPAVDGNVLRVITRVTADTSDILSPSVKKEMEQNLRGMLERTRPDAGKFTQALMELGACVCVPKGKPACVQCPLQGICLAQREKRTDEIPFKTPKKKRKVVERTVFLVTDGDRVVIHRRPEKGLLAGLYELPAVEECLNIEEALAYCGQLFSLDKRKPQIKVLPDGKHIFSHVEWHMKAYRIYVEAMDLTRLKETAEWEFVTPEELRSHYTLPSAFKTWADYLYKKENLLE